jgi:hypothetical protein
MSALTDFLHKLVDHVGAGSLHADIDKLAKDEGEEAVKSVESDVEKGEGDTTSA